ncbi:hypothetical protein L0657_06320 [Dyadobacter sp. CY345]|uniref:IPT/TIG domain-containing protein n=1 Tax=Dyadobacter sp. CY345 TaxID=2909335 RepID=UPI001F38B393|nr:IPT/TIG domain-containing protein [Dyadobacter sp. CY345]MCF2443567.1 hypothetical protein [Dyadobacter sp. CY345]
MKIDFNKRFLTALYLVLFFGIQIACKDDDVTTSEEVQLLSFGPSGVMPGENISFIGNNLEKVTAIELTGASIPSSAFVTHTAELIVLTVPKETDEGFVILKTAAGDIVSKTILSFEVPVTIKSVTAAARPGDNITITGEYMNWVREVRFAGDTAVVQFVSQTMNELVVTVPFGAETGPILLATGGTEPLSIESETELVVALPSITAMTPNPAEREKNLVIKGADLDLAMGVLFNGLTAPVTEFVSKSTSEIVVVVPKTASKGLVSLVAFSGVNVASSDTLRFINDAVAATK